VSSNSDQAADFMATRMMVHLYICDKATALAEAGRQGTYKQNSHNISVFVHIPAHVDKFSRLNV